MERRRGYGCWRYKEFKSQETKMSAGMLCKKRDRKWDLCHIDQFINNFFDDRHHLKENGSIMPISK